MIPMAMPDTGADIGTPASMRASVDPQVDAMDDDPLEESISETKSMVYGKSSLLGSTGTSAFSARAPCPTSRRPGPRIGFTSPTEYGGKL